MVLASVKFKSPFHKTGIETVNEWFSTDKAAAIEKFQSHIENYKYSELLTYGGEISLFVNGEKLATKK